MLNNSSSSAMVLALKLLGLRSHSREELQRKLQRKGYSPEIIEEVLETLTSRGVQNDLAFSMELVRSQSRRKPAGKIKIVADLRKRGVSENIIAELLKNYESGELCFQAAEKKIRSLRGTTEIEKKKKLELFLRNRGFAWNEIQLAINHFIKTDSENEEFFQESSP
ncbi:MAG: recombination regulator RecX [Chlorobium sp.]|nr:MAG: recombination regulator RecX [Chlorobium sp.]